GVVATALEGATPRVAASEDAALDGALIAETPALNETTALDETTAPAAVAAPTDAHAPESPLSSAPPPVRSRPSAPSPAGIEIASLLNTGFGASAGATDAHG